MFSQKNAVNGRGPGELRFPRVHGRYVHRVLLTECAAGRIHLQGQMADTKSVEDVGVFSFTEYHR